MRCRLRDRCLEAQRDPVVQSSLCFKSDPVPVKATVVICIFFLYFSTLHINFVSTYNLYSDSLFCTYRESLDIFCPARSCKYQQDRYLKEVWSSFNWQLFMLCRRGLPMCMHAWTSVNRVALLSEQLLSSAALLTNHGCVTISKAVSQSPVYMPSFLSWSCHSYMQTATPLV